MENRGERFYAFDDAGTGAHHKGICIDGPHLGLGWQVPLSNDMLCLLGCAVEAEATG